MNINNDYSGMPKTSIPAPESDGISSVKVSQSATSLELIFDRLEVLHAITSESAWGINDRLDTLSGVVMKADVEPKPNTFRNGGENLEGKLGSLNSLIDNLFFNASVNTENLKRLSRIV